MKQLFLAMLAATGLGLSSCDDMSVLRQQPLDGEVVSEDPAPAEQRYLTATSQFDHEETVRRLFEGLDRRDLTIFALIDHAAGARTVELDMPPAVVVIFGSPRLGTPLMKAAPILATELPLRASVYEDQDGTVKMAITSIRGVARVAPQIAQPQDRLDAIDANLKAILAEATGAED